jgi:hypothetical protein
MRSLFAEIMGNILFVILLLTPFWLGGFDFTVRRPALGWVFAGVLTALVMANTGLAEKERRKCDCERKQKAKGE